MYRISQQVLATVENVVEVLTGGGDQVRIADGIRSDRSHVRENSASIGVQNRFRFPSEDQLRDEHDAVVQDGKTGVGSEEVGDGAKWTMQNDGDDQGTGQAEVIDLHHRQ